MADDHDDIDGDDDGREAPPAVSRLGRPIDRRYRTSSRARTIIRDRGRDRYVRGAKQLHVRELIGYVIRRYGLTDDVRRHFVCLYWVEMVGEPFASRTSPVSFAKGVMEVSVVSSAWVQEMRFYNDRLIATIHEWIAANRVWLGPPPLVQDIRFVLGTRQRESLVDRDHARHLRQYHARRTRPRPRVTPPVISDADRDAIRAATSTIDDADVRDAIESVRLKWNR